MVALQRSVTSFRRQGSSGLVWGEDKLILSGVLNPTKPHGGEDGGDKIDQRQLRPSQSAGTIGMMKRSSSTVVRAPAQPRGNAVVPSSDIHPPSPKISSCCFSGVFGRSAKCPPPKPKK